MRLLLQARAAAIWNKQRIPDRRWLRVPEHAWEGRLWQASVSLLLDCNVTTEHAEGGGPGGAEEAVELLRTVEDGRARLSGSTYDRGG